MKLVTTGRTPNGASVFVEDSEPVPLVAPGFPSLVNTPLWAADAPPRLPTDGSRTPTTEFFPPPGGYRFFTLTLEPPSAEQPEPTADELAQFEGLFPGLLATWEPDDPGMHTTASIDFGIVLQGCVVLELDDGVERVLEAGDAFVQNGTRHRWRNVDRSPATMAVLILGVPSGAKTTET